MSSGGKRRGLPFLSYQTEGPGKKLCMDVVILDSGDPRKNLTTPTGFKENVPWASGRWVHTHSSGSRQDSRLPTETVG